MLMTSEKELTPLARRIIQAVETNGKNGLTRLQIAADLERPHNKLNPYDIDVLEQLVTDGHLTAEDVQIGTVKTKRVYRVKAES